MKRTYLEVSGRERNARWAVSRDQRRLNHKEWLRNKNRRQLGRSRAQRRASQKTKQKGTKWYFVQAPVVFSFLKNPEGVSTFVSELEQLFSERKPAYVVMKNVEKIDHSAIVVLMSVLTQFKKGKINFNGNYPLDKEAKEVVKLSAFVENVITEEDDEKRYTVHSQGGFGVFTHAWFRVDSELTAGIIEQQSVKIWGDARRCPGVQRSLIELMQNTNNHADVNKKGERRWWLSVNYDEKRNKTTFSFLDFGVGIFENLKEKKVDSVLHGCLLKMQRLFNYSDHSELLSLILDGKLHETVTSKYFRGKGLPGVALASKRNQISNLHVISNDAFCAYSGNVKKKLEKPFSGTFVHWELGEDNDNHK